MTAPGLPAVGLTAAEAERRLAQYGPNDPAPQKPRSHLLDLLLQFANPLVAILLLASIVSAFVGEIVNAAIIIVIVSLSVAINFVQTFRSQRAAERLRATVAPTATVLRDGAIVDCPRFVESLATQTLVLVAIVIVGVVLPYSPLAGVLGFEPLPAAYFLFLTAATLTYLLLVEIAKRYLLRGVHTHRHPIAPKSDLAKLAHGRP